MRNRKRTIVNIITSGGQVALIGVIYYFLYKYLLDELGVELLGVWSVVMSTSSIANIADLGIATSMVRFVALYDHRKNLARIPQLIFTGFMFNIVIFIPSCLIIWPIAYFALGNVVEIEYVSLARQLLPFSLLCVLLNSLSGVYGSLLDGFRQNYIRNSIFTFSSFVFLLLAIWSVKQFGLIGIVWAQVFQSFLSLVLCIFFAIRVIQFNPFRWAWSKRIFKEIFNYGIKFQLTSITGILNEPVTKMLMSKFGGLAFTGYFEMANKLIMQIRGVVVSANQSLMPLLVKENERSQGNQKRFSMLSLSFVGVFVVSLFFLSLVNILGSCISMIWIGYDEKIFIDVLLFISLSMFINLLSAPSYFYLLSVNRLNPIIVSQFLMAIINLVIGYIFGTFFGGYGIVFSWMIVVIFGSWFLIKSLGFTNAFRVLLTCKYYAFLFLLLNVVCIVISKKLPGLMYWCFVINLFGSVLIMMAFYKRNKRLFY
ncbi:MAG: oligosaccharide flippase family protein [Breznakibacter sp.]